MSVLECRRHNCENIMCDRYSTTHGYICYECFEELVNTGASTNISKFMESNKEENDSEGAYERYNAVFKMEDR